MQTRWGGILEFAPNMDRFITEEPVQTDLQRTHSKSKPNRAYHPRPRKTNGTYLHGSNALPSTNGGDDGNFISRLKVEELISKFDIFLTNSEYHLMSHISQSEGEKKEIATAGVTANILRYT